MLPRAHSFPVRAGSTSTASGAPRAGRPLPRPLYAGLEVVTRLPLSAMSDDWLHHFLEMATAVSLPVELSILKNERNFSLPSWGYDTTIEGKQIMDFKQNSWVSKRKVSSVMSVKIFSVSWFYMFSKRHLSEIRA